MGVQADVQSNACIFLRIECVGGCDKKDLSHFHAVLFQWCVKFSEFIPP